MTGYAGVLAGLGSVLVALLAFLGTFNVHVAVAPVDPAFGAVSVLTSPLEVNGTQEYVGSKAFNTASSTLCSFKTPNATTTGVVKVRAKTINYAFGYQIAGDTVNPTATTTNYGFIANPANSVGIASTTAVSFAPNTFINVVVATSSGTTVNANFTPTGVCTQDLWVD